MRKGPQDLRDQPALKARRDNKDLSVPKVPQDQEVKPGLQARRALPAHRVQRVHRALLGKTARTIAEADA